MLDFYKRAWNYFFTAFVAFVLGIIPVQIFIKNPISIVVLLLILASICLIITIIGLFYDIKDALRKDKEAKMERIHNELIESFKGMGLTNEQAEIAAKGRPDSYYNDHRFDE
jgi:ABC-type transport system involved in cytochrome bd biosynthesis fused ATPase/permease subunit